MMVFFKLKNLSPFLQVFLFFFLIFSSTFCINLSVPNLVSNLSKTPINIVITKQPADALVLSNHTATFTVTVDSNNSSSLSYQWQIATDGSNDFIDIIGATNFIYTIDSVTETDNNNQYRVIVSASGVAPVNSTVATLKVSNFIITKHPQSVVVPNSAVTFNVSVDSNIGGLNYQWQSAVKGSSDFTNIIGATSSSYTLDSVTVFDNGNQYRVRVTATGLYSYSLPNGNTKRVVTLTGSVTLTSLVATVTVSNISITGQPVSSVVAIGDTTTFSIVATSRVGTLSYQWQRAVSGSSNFTNIAGATSTNYTTPSIVLTDTGTQYRVVVSAGGTSVTSTIAMVTVSNIIITSQPTNVVATTLSPVFSVVATTNAGALSYQWQSATSDSTTFTKIAGATNSSYSIPTILSVDLNTQYQVVVTASSTSITSNPASLQVAPFTATIGGTGVIGFAEDTDGTSNTVTSQFNAPYAVAVDSSLNIYVADYSNHRIRKIKPNGDTVTIGGTGGANFVEDTDGVLSTVTSQFNNPTAVAVDASNNVYVADYNNHRIRKIKPNGDTATIGGTGVGGFAEDTDGTSNTVTSQFYNPIGIAVDSLGNVYVSDNTNHRIRKIKPNGDTSTIGGTGEANFGEDTDGVLSTVTSQFHFPAGVSVDSSGNVYVADRTNHRIRKIKPNGDTVTIGGTGVANFVEDTDGILSTVTSQFNRPTGVSVDSSGNVYVADYLNYRIRKIKPNGDTVTIGGTGEANFGEDTDGVLSTVTSQFNLSYAVTVDSLGNVYVADTSNHRIRIITQ